MSALPAPVVRVRLPRGGTLQLGLGAGVHRPDPYAPELIAALRVPRGGSFLDLGCGAGTYGLAAAALGAGRAVLTDVVPAAVAAARANAERNGVADRVDVREGSLFEPVRGERFDAIFAALPQLPAPSALDLVARYGGADGLDLKRPLAAGLPRHLAPGGRAYLLVTGWAGPGTVGRLLEAHGLRVRCAKRVRRPFQPAEYDAYQPGLFAYLDAHARGRDDRPAYTRRGAWCYLEVSLLEASPAGRRSGRGRA